MTSPALQQAIDAVARTGDLASVADHLADDVELSVAVAVDLPPSLKLFGKPSVIEHLRNTGVPSAQSQGKPRELYASGERIVALCDEQVAIGRGFAVRSACALVFDVEGESITRIGVHFELSPTVTSARRDGTRRRGTRTDDDFAPELQA